MLPREGDFLRRYRQAPAKMPVGSVAQLICERGSAGKSSTCGCHEQIFGAE
jgi:hypothetical protein